MASIRAFSRTRARPALLAALVALLLAVAGALGWAPFSEPSSARRVVVVDASPSCEPPDPIPEGAIRFDADDAATALSRAAAVKGVERIVLFTDAVFSETPAPPQVPVDVVLRPRRDDFGVLDVRLPSRAGAGTDFVVEVDVGRTASRSHGPKVAMLKVLRDGERIGGEARRLRLAPGERTTVRIRDRVPEAGLVRYRAVLLAPVGAAANDEREAFLRVGDLPLVLAVGRERPPAAEGFLWETRRPEQVAEYLAGKAAERVDAILLRGDLPSRTAQERVARAVRGGAGLLVVGGAGFSGKPLEAVLPLTDKPPGGRAAVLLLDYSGSMHERTAALARGVARLLDAFAPTDRIAMLVFRDRVVYETGWAPAGEARWDPRREQPRGNTALAPALERARVLLEQVESEHKRLFVVSDGEWKDAEAAAPMLRGIAALGIHTAALFVEPPKAGQERLFDAAYHAGDDLAPALKALEQNAPDRRIAGPLRATVGSVARWLDPARPAPGDYRDVERLYPRGVGERVALRAKEVPLLATLEPGGRVVVAATPELPIEGLLRCCLRTGDGVDLRAWREGAGLRLAARGDAAESFFVGDLEVPARPVGPGRWSARLDRVERGALRVRFGAATRLVPPAAAVELAGLTSRPEIAAAIAGRSGGRLYRDTLPADESGSRPAVYLTLLAAAACVVLGAMARRGA